MLHPESSSPINAIGHAHRGILRVAILLVVGLTLLFGGLLAVRSATPPEAEELISALSRTRSVQDVMPEAGWDGQPISVGVVDSDSARLLHSTPASRYWVSESTSGEICLAVYYEPESRPVDWHFSAGCIPPHFFVEKGLLLTTEGPGGGFDAHLLPDGIMDRNGRDAVGDFGGEVPVDNLVVFPLGDRPETFKLDGIDMGKP